MNTQIINFQFKDFHEPFMTLQSIGFNFFAKIMRGSCVFCCSSCISFNPTSHLNKLCLYMNSRYWRKTVIKLLNLTYSVYNFSNNGSETESSGIKTSTLALEHVSAQDTWACKHARHVNMWARKHARDVGTWARKHARHVGKWARV